MMYHVRLICRLAVHHFQVTYYSMAIKTVVVMYVRRDAEVHDNLPYNITEL